MGRPLEGSLLGWQKVTAAVDPIALAERILTLLEVGSFSATYKYALLTALLDLCIERTSAKGHPPQSLTTFQVAEKVAELYWQHATPYEGGAILRQGGVRTDHQAEILSEITRFRVRHGGSLGELFHRARLLHQEDFRGLLRTVEWKLIQMPIPRLQVVGRGTEDRFLYEYHWDQDVRRSEVAAYQDGKYNAFDNRLLLRPGVPEALVALNGVLRPVIHREWALKVADLNALPEQKLQEFLFGSSRVALGAVSAPLRDLQHGRCFYCDDRLAERGDVDHFIPWARYPENALDNLVLAHPGCNGKKRDFFAAVPHLVRWSDRSRIHGDDLAAIATGAGWPRDLERSRAVATALYARLPEGAPLWLSGDTFEALDRTRVTAVLGDG